MASIMGERTALGVLEVVGRGGKPNISEIAIKAGFAPSSARSGKPQETKEYKRIMSKEAAKMGIGVNKALDAINKKDFHKEKLPALVQAVDVLNKNRRLEIGKVDSVPTQPIMVIENFNYTPTQNNRIVKQEKSE